MTSTLHLPDFLIGKHRRYKADTNRLATFLAQTAHRLGYSDEIGLAPAAPSSSAAAASQPKSARLKGKARKVAAASNSAAAPTPGKPAATASNADAGPATIVSTKQFVDLATYIAARDPRVRIPNAILTWARRAIRARRQCAEWFLPKDSAPTADAPGSVGAAPDAKTEMVNQAHWHFIRVLTKVVEILAPLVSSGGKSAATAEDGQASPDGSLEAKRKADGVQGVELLESRFAVLSVDDATAELPDEVEDDDQDADQDVDMDALVLYTTGAAAAADHRQPGKGNNNNKKQQQHTYRVEDDDGEVFLSLFCFFNDLDRVRAFLKESWTQYRDGTLDLVTASLVTSTAMDLVRQAQADLLAFHPRLGDYHGMTYRFYITTCVLRGLPPAPLDPADIVNPEMGDIAEFLFLPIHSLLVGFKKVLQPGLLPVYRKGHFGIYDPLVDRSRLSMRDRMQEDRLILHELMPELVLMERTKVTPPACDTLSEEFNTFVRTKCETPILVFAVQVFLDIHEIMREQVGRGLQELQSTGSSILASLDLYDKHKHRATSSKWTRTHQLGVENLRKNIDVWIMRDLYLPEKQKHYRDHLRRAPAAAQPAIQDQLDNLDEFALLKHHPWMCGLLQFQTLLKAHEAGLAMADNWGTILYTGHLYEAGKIGRWIKSTYEPAVGRRIGPWDDMEYVMVAHGKDKMFRGRVPETLREAVTSVQLMMGASGVDLVSLARGKGRKKSRGQGPGNVKAASGGAVGLAESTPVCGAFRERYLYKEHPDVSLAGVEALITRMIEKELASSSSSSSPPRRTRGPTPQDEPLTYLQRKWRNSHTLSPMQLLRALRAVLAREHDLLRFDYIRMHVRCVQALRAVHEEVDERLKRYISPKYFPSEELLAWLPAYLLIVSSGTERVAELVKSPAAVKAAARRAREVAANDQDSGADADRTGDTRSDAGMDAARNVESREGLEDVQVGSRILRDASNVLQAWIDAEGDVECWTLISLCAAYAELANRPRPLLCEPTRLWAWQNFSFNGRAAGVSGEEWDHRQALMSGYLETLDEQGLEFNAQQFVQVVGAGGFGEVFTADEVRAMIAAHQQRRHFAQLHYELQDNEGATRDEGPLRRRG